MNQKKLHADQSMEATKRRASEEEQVKKKKAEQETGARNMENESKETKAMTVEEMIRESVIGGNNEEDKNVQQPDDVLAFSRSVNKIDSSLE